MENIADMLRDAHENYDLVNLNDREFLLSVEDSKERDILTSFMCGELCEGDEYMSFDLTNPLLLERICKDYGLDEDENRDEIYQVYNEMDLMLRHHDGLVPDEQPVERYNPMDARDEFMKVRDGLTLPEFRSELDGFRAELGDKDVDALQKAFDNIEQLYRQYDDGEIKSSDLIAGIALEFSNPDCEAAYQHLCELRGDAVEQPEAAGVTVEPPKTDTAATDSEKGHKMTWEEKYDSVTESLEKTKGLPHIYRDTFAIAMRVSQSYYAMKGNIEIHGRVPTVADVAVGVFDLLRSNILETIVIRGFILGVDLLIKKQDVEQTEKGDIDLNPLEHFENTVSERDSTDKYAVYSRMERVEGINEGYGLTLENGTKVPEMRCAVDKTSGEKFLVDCTGQAYRVENGTLVPDKIIRDLDATKKIDLSAEQVQTLRAQSVDVYNHKVELIERYREDQNSDVDLTPMPGFFDSKSELMSTERYNVHMAIEGRSIEVGDSHVPELRCAIDRESGTKYLVDCTGQMYAINAEGRPQADHVDRQLDLIDSANVPENEILQIRKDALEHCSDFVEETKSDAVEKDMENETEAPEQEPVEATADEDIPLPDVEPPEDRNIEHEQDSDALDEISPAETTDEQEKSIDTDSAEESVDDQDDTEIPEDQQELEDSESRMDYEVDDETYDWNNEEHVVEYHVSEGGDIDDDKAVKTERYETDQGSQITRVTTFEFMTGRETETTVRVSGDVKVEHELITEHDGTVFEKTVRTSEADSVVITFEVGTYLDDTWSDKVMIIDDDRGVSLSKETVFDGDGNILSNTETPDYDNLVSPYQNEINDAAKRIDLDELQSEEDEDKLELDDLEIDDDMKEDVDGLLDKFLTLEPEDSGEDAVDKKEDAVEVEERDSDAVEVDVDD